MTEKKKPVGSMLEEMIEFWKNQKEYHLREAKTCQKYITHNKRSILKLKKKWSNRK